MIYRFHSKAAGDVLMLGPVGDSVLHAMGIAPAAKGIIEAHAMPAAMRAIEAAVVRDEALPSAGGSAAETRDADDGTGAVSLRQRAWPLVEMMRRAQDTGEAIVWGV